jgi:hypothetical protein
MADISDYTNRITSQHRSRPKFIAKITALNQGLVDTQNIADQIPSMFDVETAVGDQLDKLGEWIGSSRNLTVPLTNVFFSWGIEGLGWGQGTWFSSIDTESGLVVLPDDSYRVLLLSLIAINHWDGTIPGAYSILSLLQSLTDTQILIKDNQDMTISVIVLSNNLSAVFLALLHSGNLIMKPAGVGIANYFSAVTPVFGWGPESDVVKGWGSGNWLQLESL